MKVTGRQTVVFTSLYISYTMYVYVRRSFSFIMPAVAEAQTLEKSQLGMIISSQSFAYAISKFVSGILVDLISPKLLFSAGLIMSGITAIFFTAFDTAVSLSMLWFLNGISQGPGWPALAVIIRKWCDSDQFGTVWSVLSTSMNVAGTVGPLVSVYLVTEYDWQDCMQLAGLVSIAVGCVCFVFIKNQPHTTMKATSQDKEQEALERPSRWQLLFLPGFLGICFCYFTTAIVQYGVLQWAQLFMVQERGQTFIAGSAFVSSVELGGVAGSFVAGYLSDSLILQNPHLPRPVARKVLIMYFTVFLTCILYWFTISISPETSKAIVTLMGFLIGFGIYGPIAIFGVVAMESGPSEFSGTLHAIAGLASNFGVMMSGLPLSFVAKSSDWNSTFLLLCTLLIVNFTYLVIRVRNDLRSTGGVSLKVFPF